MPATVSLLDKGPPTIKSAGQWLTFWKWLTNRDGEDGIGIGGCSMRNKRAITQCTNCSVCKLQIISFLYLALFVSSNLANFPTQRTKAIGERVLFGQFGLQSGRFESHSLGVASGCAGFLSSSPEPWTRTNLANKADTCGREFTFENYERNTKQQK